LLGSAISPSQRGDVDALAHEIVGALIDVRTLHSTVAFWVSRRSATSNRRPKLGPCGVTHSLTADLFHGAVVESSAVPEVM
jgi:hypothetical protein